MGNFNLLKDVIVTFFWFSTFLEHSFGELYTLFQEKIHWQLSVSAPHGNVWPNTGTTVKTVPFI